MWTWFLNLGIKWTVIQWNDKDSFQAWIFCEQELTFSNFWIFNKNFTVCIWQHCIFSPLYLHSTILFTFFLENSLVASTDCRSPWIHLSNGKWYQSSENPMSFAKVNTFCQSIGGRVAEVSSVDDYWSIKFHLGKP